jgi:SET family sugar efflux transporter-like MFS transporter
MGSGRIFAALAAAVLLLGLADSIALPYLVLFAADEAGLTPLQVGLFASATGLGGIIVSHLLGRRFDSRPTRAYLVGVTVAGAIGYVLLSVTRTFPLLVLLGLTLLGSVAAGFPQLFTLARVVLGNGSAGERSAPLLRSGWSLAWAIGPLVGAVLLARTGFTGIFWATSAALLLTAAVTSAIPSPGSSALAMSALEGDRPEGLGPPPLSPAIVALLALSVMLFFTAMFAGSLALPFFVTRELHRPDTSLGGLASACAAVEIVAALALAWAPPRISRRWLIIAGMALFVGYFTMILFAQGLGLLLVSQVPRGVAIAVVGAAGIRYFQDALAPATGRATTLFSNATTAGLLFAGVLAGASLQAFGYRATLLLCGITALIATFTFALATRPRFARERERPVQVRNVQGGTRPGRGSSRS